MTEIKASENIGVLVPENDSQKLWNLNGRVEAIKGLCRRAIAIEQSVDPMMLLLMLGENEKAGATNTGSI